MSRRKTTCLLGLLCLLGLWACEGEVSVTADAAVAPDGGVAEAQCVEDPMTHIEIINACTTATAVQKTPVTPLLGADGTLPPLP